MRYFKCIFIPAIIFAFLNIHLSMGGTAGNEVEEAMKLSQVKYDLRETVKGSIEDQSWMKSKSKEEVYTALRKYFDGYLLSDLTDSSWKFIEQPTDLYSRDRLIDLVVLYDDGKRASAEALIGMDDLETGHTEFGNGLFELIKKDEGWKIDYVAFNWENQYDKR